jgi:aldose sugar dehydrogenase
VARAALALLLALLLLGGCGGNDEPDAPPPPPPEDTAPDDEEVEDTELELEREVVATGLEIPWGVAFRGDDEIFLGERGGRIRVVRDGELVAEPVAEIQVVAEGEAGLLGLAMHPDEPLLYAYYTHPTGANRIVRFPVEEGGPAGVTLGEEEVVLDGIPAARIHDGGRIAFGPDGMLYATTGDTGEPARSAELDSLAGKILRIDPEGSAPGDNPRDSPVWSWGHRNPQGLDWDDEGRLYASEHGPTGEFGLCCLDEVNLIEPGEFYGWPVRSGGQQAAPGEVEVDAEPVDPVATSGPDDTWAPGGLAVHSPSRSLLVPNLAGRQLLRLVVSADDPQEIERQETVIDDLGRLRTIVRGPDDCFYLTTSNRDGRGDPQDGDDRLVRLCPSD